MAEPRGGRAISPLAFWGTIQAAVERRATTAELWAAIRDRTAETGWELPRGMFGEVNRLRSIAASLRRSAEAIAKASPDDPLTSSMIGRLPYARDAVSQSLLPAWHVRTEVRVVRAGEESREWLTLEYQGALPATVGDLRSVAAAIAAAILEGYNAELAELGTIEVGAW